MRSSFIEKERTSSRLYSSTIVVSPDGAALARIRTGLATPATFAPTGPTAATRAKWESNRGGRLVGADGNRHSMRPQPAAAEA